VFAEYGNSTAVKQKYEMLARKWGRIEKVAVNQNLH
jgi:hypothetical protein